jgi:chromosome segregation protein
LTAVNAQQPDLEAALLEAEAAARQATDSTLPEKEAALREAQQAVGDAQRVVSQLDQSRQVDENSLGHTKRQLEQLDARQRRLVQEGAQLPRPDAGGLAKKQVEVEELSQTCCPNSTPHAPGTRASSKPRARRCTRPKPNLPR